MFEYLAWGKCNAVTSILESTRRVSEKMYGDVGIRRFAVRESIERALLVVGGKHLCGESRQQHRRMRSPLCGCVSGIRCKAKSAFSDFEIPYAALLPGLGVYVCR